MRKIGTKLAVLVCAVAMSSCIGQFRLTNNLLDWNEGVGSKFVNEIIFLGLHVIPAYQACMLVDFFVLNSIEFWGGNSGIASVTPGTEKYIDNNGALIRVTATDNGYHLEQVGAEAISNMDLVYSETDQTWSAVNSLGETKIMKRINDNKVLMYMPNQESIEAELSEQGLAQLKNELSPALSINY